MSNFLGDTYKALLERVLEKHEAGEGKQHLLTGIKHVDLYYGQDLDERPGKYANAFSSTCSVL